MEQTPGPQDPETSGGSTPPTGAPMPPPGGDAPLFGGPTPPGWAPLPRRLYRLRNNRVLAGVASGLGAYFDVDPIWVRLAFIVLTFFGGAGILLYLVCWVVMPAADFAPPIGTMPPGPGRRIYRLRNDRVVAGVASGLGAHLEVDPLWIRLAFVVLTFFAGLGVILYIIGCVAMPLVDGIPPGGMPGGGAFPPRRGPGEGTELRIVAGAVVLIVAVFVLAGTFHFHDSGLIWGAALIGIGLLFLIGDRWPSRYAGGGPPLPPSGFAPTAAYSPPAAGGGAGASGGEGPAASSSTAPPYVPPIYSAYTPYTPQPAYTAYSPQPAYTAYSPQPAYTAYSPQPVYSAPAYGTQAAWSGSAPRSGGLRLGTIGLAAVILAAGVALLLQSLGLIHLTAESGLGTILLVLGLTLVVGARFGGSGGLVALGICLLPFAAAAVLVPEPLAGGVGNISYSPQTLSAVQPTYRLAAGQLYVDLSAVDLGSGNVAVTSSVAFGHLVVVVPADESVDLTGKVGAGEDDLLGRIDSGVQISSHFVATGPASAGTLTLNLSVGCGQLTVETGPSTFSPVPSPVGTAGVAPILTRAHVGAR